MQDTRENTQEVSGTEGPSADFKTKEQHVQDKFVALYQARKVLSLVGTMEERRIANMHLKRMRKMGVNSL